MITKTLSDKALSVINEYRNFNIGDATCSIPYYNNKHLRLRATLRAQGGKGSPREILEEVEQVAAQQKINLKALDSASLKNLLVDTNIGIDCSGLAYYILSAEKGGLNLSFPFSKGILGKLRSTFRKIENAGVATFAHDANSSAVSLRNVEPSDIITMVGDPDERVRDHILTVHQVDLKDGVPTVIHYTHAMAWPSDGEYGHGVRQGIITLTNLDKPITEQEWIEADKTGSENYTFTRAQKSTTSLRRLRIL